MRLEYLPKISGLPEKALNVLKAMYSETYSQVRVKNTISLKFKIVSGVRQGSILSTFLFNHCIDWIMEQALSNDLLGLTLDGMMIADLDFADDICLIDDKVMTHRSYLIMLLTMHRKSA